MDLSIVVPVYNEELSVKPLYEAITNALNKLNLDYEILLVDDGSSDNTYLNAQNIAEKDSRLKVIKLKRNYGQTIGLHAGFQNASGKIIVTMDGDLQNDPDDIAEMIEEINKGNDIVLGWRYDRKDKMISRKIPSKIANKLISKLTGVPVKDNGCAIRAYRSEVIKKFPMYSEMHRLLPVMTALSGAKFTQIKVKHHARKFGSSKYGLSRIYKVMIDMVALKIIFTFFYLPLYGFGLFSMIFGMLCLLTLLFGILQILLYPGISLVTIMGASLLLGSLSFFLLFLGIISDLIYQNGEIKIERLLKNRRMNKRVFYSFKRSN
ncbi:MAG: glycosyltransferase family 2 protein [Candidatus Thorarchaeota archaeon]